MAFPAPLSPLDDAAGPGLDPLTSPFADLAGDFLAPLDPAELSPPPPAAPDAFLLAALVNFSSPEPPALSSDTSACLQELASSLLASPALAPTPGAAFSLTSLADQLSARFLNPEAPDAPRADLPDDLLAAPARPPAPALPRAASPAAIRAALPVALPPHPFFLDAPLEAPRPCSAAWSDEFDAAPLDFLSPEPTAAATPAAAALAAAVPLVPPSAGSASGAGLLLGGAGLILLGIALACRLPLLWLDLDGAGHWARQNLEAGLLLQAAGAVFALVLGMGSLMLRRWAPPLIHASGWLAVFASVLLLGAVGVGLGADSEPFLGAASALGLAASLLGPLAYLFYYERESVAATCAAADPRPAWTDRQTVPALLVLLCHLLLALAAGAMLQRQPAFPLPTGEILRGPAASAAWSGLGALGLLGAYCAWRRWSGATWLLLLAALGLAATLGACGLSGRPPWDAFLAALGRPSDLPSPSPLLPLLVGLSPAPLFLVLAMARRAFLSSTPP